MLIAAEKSKEEKADAEPADEEEEEEEEEEEAAEPEPAKEEKEPEPMVTEQKGECFCLLTEDCYTARFTTWRAPNMWS